MGKDMTSSKRLRSVLGQPQVPLTILGKASQIGHEMGAQSRERMTACMEKMIASSHPNTAASRDIDFLDIRDRITLENPADIEVPPGIDDQALVAADPKSTVRISASSGDMAV